MFLTLKQFVRKIKKSEGTARIYLDRYSIKQIKLKNTKQLVYDISKEQLNEIIKFSSNRRSNKYKS